MKTAYELAMERLNKAAPSVKLTAAQKRKLAELDSKYAAKLAEREIYLTGRMTQAEAEGNFAEMTKLSEELARDRDSLAADLEAKKEQVRRSGGQGDASGPPSELKET